MHSSSSGMTRRTAPGNATCPRLCLRGMKDPQSPSGRRHLRCPDARRTMHPIGSRRSRLDRVASMLVLDCCRHQTRPLLLLALPCRTARLARYMRPRSTTGSNIPHQHVRSEISVVLALPGNRANTYKGFVKAEDAVVTSFHALIVIGHHVPSLLHVASRNCLPACRAVFHSSGVDRKVPVNG